MKAIDRQHHMSGILRMNQMGDDAIDLLYDVDPPSLILFL